MAASLPALSVGVLARKIFPHPHLPGVMWVPGSTVEARFQVASSDRSQQRTVDHCHRSAVWPWERCPALRAADVPDSWSAAGRLFAERGDYQIKEGRECY